MTTNVDGDSRKPTCDQGYIKELNIVARREEKRVIILTKLCALLSNKKLTHLVNHPPFPKIANHVHDVNLRFSRWNSSIKCNTPCKMLFVKKFQYQK